ncbi:MAG TPA: hypothetical protein VK433_04445 [Stellaceae bacterium]|nr:hypothetical protein [Stellaceae bacterium]
MAGNPAVSLFGVILLALGLVGLAYGGFTYTQRTQEAQLGPVTLEVKDQRTVNIPMWAGVAGVALGGGLIAIGLRRR